MINRSKVIVALDLEHADDAVQMAKNLSSVFPFFKIGSKLFTQAGPPLVKQILNYGRVFLDLKYYDIPSVVADAVLQAAKLGVSLLTLHASGGSDMMRMCAESIKTSSTPVQLLAVTVLTSFDDLREFNIERTVEEQVRTLVKLAYNAGMDGIVCSPAELQSLRKDFNYPFLMVTPGIRSASDAKGDQKRIASPAEAIKAGADYIVIGRPITAAADPIQAAQQIAESITGMNSQ